MPKPRLQLIAFALAAMLITPASVAESRQWVTDQLSIIMRSGAGTEFSIANSLKSGTPVTVLESNADNGYSRIAIESGAEGWVLTRFLVDRPGLNEQLAAAKATIAGLTDESQPIAVKLVAADAENANLRATASSLESRAMALEEELATLRNLSADAVRLNDSNQKLVSLNQALQNDIDILRAENARLVDKSDMEWFLNGTFAVAFGVFLAIIIPRLRPRSKQSEWA